MYARCLQAGPVAATSVVVPPTVVSTPPLTILQAEAEIIQTIILYSTGMTQYCHLFA